jgi:hypothetical protein
MAPSSDLRLAKPALSESVGRTSGSVALPWTSRGQVGSAKTFAGAQTPANRRFARFRERGPYKPDTAVMQRPASVCMRRAEQSFRRARSLHAFAAVGSNCCGPVDERWTDGFHRDACPHGDHLQIATRCEVNRVLERRPSKPWLFSSRGDFTGTSRPDLTRQQRKAR